MRTQIIGVMNNPFEYINKPIKQVPPELKAKVMSDVAMAKLIMEIAELFSYNFAYIIDTVSSKRKKD